MLQSSAPAAQAGPAEADNDQHGPHVPDAHSAPTDCINPQLYKLCLPKWPRF